MSIIYSTRIQQTRKQFFTFTTFVISFYIFTRGTSFNKSLDFNGRVHYRNDRAQVRTAQYQWFTNKNF